MKQEELTEKQLAILEEIHQLVLVGEQKLKEYSEESAVIDEKWRRRAEAKRAAAIQNQKV
ncbi:MAG TPA: hypothetical protein V6D16_22265 [Candidatus Obscuribacterales bacterium]